MIGPGAGQTIAIGEPGEKSLGFPASQIGALEALRKLDPNAHVTSAAADDMTGVRSRPPPMTANPADAHRSQDQRQRSGGPNRLHQLKRKGASGGLGLEMDGTAEVPSAGSYSREPAAPRHRRHPHHRRQAVGDIGNHTGNIHGNILVAGEHNIVPTPDALDNLRRRVELTAGAHTIAVDSTADISGNPVQLRLAWMTPEKQKAEHDAAIARRSRRRTR